MPIHCKSLAFAQSISISLGYTFSYWNAVDDIQLYYQGLFFKNYSISESVATFENVIYKCIKMLEASNLQSLASLISKWIKV